jgi:CheY-like chemotaxis protein
MEPLGDLAKFPSGSRPRKRYGLLPFYCTMKPFHILVTDDDDAKRKLLTLLLLREFPNALIFQCRSGQEALDHFEHNAVDALITDNSMFPVNGIELVKKLRERGSTIPIIMVSGNVDVATEAEYAGVNLFIGGSIWKHLTKSLAVLLRSRGLNDN